MDSTVIKEIANQLGMAVDQAGQFVTEQLPGYAALQCVKIASPFIALVVLLVLLIVVAIVSHSIFVKQYAEKMRDYDRELAEYKEKKRKRLEAKDISSSFEFLFEPSEPRKDSFLFHNIMFACVIAAASLAVALLVMAGVMVPKLIGWSNYPEAMLIDMALKAVG